MFKAKQLSGINVMAVNAGPTAVMTSCPNFRINNGGRGSYLVAGATPCIM